MSPSQDPEADALADLIDDTDGREVQADTDLEPTSSIPADAAATGEGSDISDPELADIMADDDARESSPQETEPEPEPAPAPQPSEVSADSASGDEEQAFRSRLIGLVAPDDTEQIILLRRALDQSGQAVPSLTDIAGDVTGEKFLATEGDCDAYSGRPGGRAQGWIVGLSFGSPMRAKNFAV